MTYENNQDEVKQAAKKELDILYSIPSVYSNRIYMGLDGEVFRITFC